VIHKSHPLGQAIVLICLALCVAFRLHAIFGTDPLLLAASIEDDSFYYTVPAFKWVETGFVTFDGINKTYGWQPLWMLVNMGVALLVRDIGAVLQWTMAAATGLYALSVWLLYRFALRLRMSPVAAGAAIACMFCFNLQMCEIFTRGKENALHFFLLMVLLNLWSNGLKLSLPRAAVSGLLIGMLALARVTAGIVVVPFALVTLWAFKGINRNSIQTLAATGIAALLVAVPWFLFAQGEFGSFLPTSGVAKIASGGGLIHHRPDIFTRDTLVTFGRGLQIVKDLGLEYYWQSGFSRVVKWGVACLPVALAISLAIAMAGAWRNRRKHIRPAASPAAEALAILVGYALLNFLLHTTMLRNYFFYGVWYHVPEYAALAIGICWMASRTLDSLGCDQPLRPSGLRFLYIGIVFAVLLWASYPYTMRIRFGMFLPRVNAVALSIDDARPFIQQHIPPGTVIASSNSGIFGFLLPNYCIVNLDGLANSMEYVRATHQGLDATRAFLRQLNIRYIMDSEDLDWIGTRGFMEIVFPDEYQILWTGHREIWWGAKEVQGTPKFTFILQLEDDAFTPRP